MVIILGPLGLRPQPDLERSGKWEMPIRLVIRVREKIPGKAVASMADRKAQNGRFRWFFDFSGFAAKMGVKGSKQVDSYGNLEEHKRS